MTVASKISIKSVQLCISASYTASEEELNQMRQELEKTLSALGLKPDILNCTTGSTEVVIEFLHFLSEKLAAGAIGAMGGLFFNYFRKNFRRNSKQGDTDTFNVPMPDFKSYDNPLATQVSSSQKNYESIKSDYLSRFPFELTDSQKFEHLSALTSTAQKSAEAKARYFIEYEDEDGNIRVESWSMEINNGKLTEISKNIRLKFPEG